MEFYDFLNCPAGINKFSESEWIFTEKRPPEGARPAQEQDKRVLAVLLSAEEDTRLIVF